VGAEGDTAFAVLADGTFMLTEGVPADSTTATLVPRDTVTTTELSLTTLSVDVTVWVLLWPPFDTSTAFVKTMLEVTGCAEETITGTDMTLVSGTPLPEVDAGPAGEVI
jgi:hypothetical protein